MPEKQETQQTSSGTAAPWAPQIPYLTSAFQQAQNIYDQNAGHLYNGQQVAQYNPQQLSTFQSMLGYGNNNTAPSTTSSTGSTLATSGSGALTGALDALANFRPSGGTQSNIDAASAYSDNPAISGMVQAAMRDANQQAADSTLPQIARNAAATGNINSNRTAIQNGIVQRGLAQKAGDISANLRGQAYTQGLNLAEQNSEANNNAMLAAMTGAGSLGNNATTTGVNALSSGINQQGALYGLAQQGGAGLQASDQAAIDNAKAMSQYGYAAPFDLLNNYFNIIGQRGYGGQTTGTQQGETEKYASPLTIAGGVLSLL